MFAAHGLVQAHITGMFCLRLTSTPMAAAEAKTSKDSAQKQRRPLGRAGPRPGLVRHCSGCVKVRQSGHSCVVWIELNRSKHFCQCLRLLGSGLQTGNQLAWTKGDGRWEWSSDLRDSSTEALHQGVVDDEIGTSDG